VISLYFYLFPALLVRSSNNIEHIVSEQEALKAPFSDSRMYEPMSGYGTQKIVGLPVKLLKFGHEIVSVKPLNAKSRVSFV